MLMLSIGAALPFNYLMPSASLQAKHAQLFGGSGLILYSDPKDYSASKTHSVYPDSWWLPGTGVQRGSLNMDVDPLTPGYPGTGGIVYCVMCLVFLLRVGPWSQAMLSPIVSSLTLSAIQVPAPYIFFAS